MVFCPLQEAISLHFLAAMCSHQEFSISLKYKPFLFTCGGSLCACYIIKIRGVWVPTLTQLIKN